MSYQERCTLLKWGTLEKRRTYQSLVECYKTVFNLNGISFHEVSDYKFTNKTRVNHKYTLYTKLLRLDCYKHSFFVRIIKLWNDLPHDVAEAENLTKFKKQLKNHMNMF